ISHEANFGEQHPTTAGRYSNLALVLKDLGDYKGSFVLALKAYRIYAGLLGQQHPTTMIIEGNLEVIESEMLEKGWSMEQIEALMVPG
ncbi:MAG: tetratricopeptide repeat protein, partial [Saprospiraceae bacterium]|nr:tetratricopeptide repeat protein [Saprospiraceae bacterium]